MVEIALCIAIIGFALVAIIGVLPAAMRVQQDNRSDTLIDQDGNYFMEAIRHGARGLDELPNYVEQPSPGNPYPIRFVYTPQNATAPFTNGIDPKRYTTGERLIGILSAPRTNYDDFRVEAEFRAISGAAVEKDPNSLISFDYLLVSEIVPFTAFDARTTFETADPKVLLNISTNLQTSLYELRLTFRWPLSPVNGSVGNNKKVFRCLVSGNLRSEVMDYWPYFFFQPKTFAQ